MPWKNPPGIQQFPWGTLGRLLVMFKEIHLDEGICKSKRESIVCPELWGFDAENKPWSWQHRPCFVGNWRTGMNWVRNPICLISSCPTISNDHNVFISIVYSTAKCANITSEANITYHSGNGMLPYFSYSHDLNPNHYWTPFNIIWLYIYTAILYTMYIYQSLLLVFLTGSPNPCAFALQRLQTPAAKVHKMMNHQT